MKGVKPIELWLGGISENRTCVINIDTGSSIRYWTKSSGLVVKIIDMNNHHISSVLKCLRGEGATKIPDVYNGRRREEWIKAFELEVAARELMIQRQPLKQNLYGTGNTYPITQTGTVSQSRVSRGV